MTKIYDVAVVGGGLAGLAASKKLCDAGKQVVLIDKPVAEAKGKLGGFAEFSGAKFSLLPAGQGLLAVGGGEISLRASINEALEMLGLSERASRVSADFSVTDKSNDLPLRRYESIVLLPDEISDLLTSFGEQVEKAALVVRKNVEAIEPSDVFSIRTSEWDVYRAKSVLYAGGRSGTELLSKMGAVAQDGKGLDVGVRLEFDDAKALKGLRDLGPDAKIISGRTRTFCLNAPGKIFVYNFQGVNIPGGVVAEPNHQSGNVGILCRLSNKKDELPRILSALKSVQGRDKAARNTATTGLLADKHEIVREVYGIEVQQEIEDFLDLLSNKHLIDFKASYCVHFPLIDWHWPVFAVGKTHKTSIDGLFVTGDTSGHARGLLQAAVSGLISAREMIQEGL